MIFGVVAQKDDSWFMEVFRVPRGVFCVIDTILILLFIAIAFWMGKKIHEEYLRDYVYDFVMSE